MEFEVLAGEQLSATDNTDARRDEHGSNQKGEGSDKAEPSLEGPVG